MITLTKIRELNLSAAPTPGRPLHLSAASGLACLKSFIYVVTDDELHLGVFRTADSEPGHLIRLFDGALPIPNRIAKSKSPTLKLSRCFLISGITLMVRSWRSVPVPGAIAAWALCSDWTRKAQCAVHSI